MSNNKSISWINAIKALSIIAVFFVHCQLYYGCVLQGFNCFIYPWYVNAFFFVSGYLLFWKQLSEPKILENRAEYVVGGVVKCCFSMCYIESSSLQSSSASSSLCRAA